MDRKSKLYKFLRKCESPDGTPFWNFMNTLFSMASCLYGVMVYKKLKKQYKGSRLIVMFTPSAGDQLLLKLGFDYFLKTCSIGDYKLISHEKNKRIYQTLEYKNTVFISANKINSLIKAYYFLHDKMPDMINAYNWIIWNFRYISEDLVKNYPVMQVDKEKCKKQFDDISMPKGRSVILSPYEQSITALKLKKLPHILWEKLADELKKRGYAVFTNCSGSDTEPVIRGTKKIFPLFSETEYTVAYAGHMIAVRSGFVDYSCRADAVKAVLYPIKNWFGTNYMGLSDDVHEHCYADVDLDNGLDSFLNDILKDFPGVNI